MALSFAYSRTTAFRLFLKKIYISMVMALYLPFGSKMAMLTFDNDMYIQIVSKQRQKPGAHCSVGTGTLIPTTKW